MKEQRRTCARFFLVSVAIVAVVFSVVIFCEVDSTKHKSNGSPFCEHETTNSSVKPVLLPCFAIF